MSAKLRRHKRWLWAFLLVLSAGFVTGVWQAPVVYSQAIAPDEIRGVWMTNYGTTLMYHSTRLDEVVANLAQHHLNTLYPAVWNRGYTLHPSQVAKQAGGQRRDRLTSLPLLPWLDPLKAVIHQAHRQHLRLIPWFEYGLMMPVNSAIAQQHPDWLTTNQAGETVNGGLPTTPRAPVIRSLWHLQQEATGASQGWLNPFHPEVQQLLIDLIAEVVQRYPVEGIQLDDHFGLPVEFGYDAYTQTLYQQEHGGQAPPADPTDAEWMRWRAAKITHLMERIVAAVKAIQPEAVISLSPNAPAFAYNQYLQDWRHWVDLGLLDEVIVQVYRDDIAALQAELTAGGFTSVNQQIPVAIGLYTGPARRPKAADQIRQESAAVKATGYRGMVYFCWETTLWIFKHGSAQQMETLFTQQWPLPPEF
ncbi:MAG: family 10 glycosylhydrolase [Cyanobacteria bacterium J06626_4]